MDAIELLSPWVGLEMEVCREAGCLEDKWAEEYLRLIPSAGRVCSDGRIGEEAARQLKGHALLLCHQLKQRLLALYGRSAAADGQVIRGRGAVGAMWTTMRRRLARDSSGSDVSGGVSRPEWRARCSRRIGSVRAAVEKCGRR